MALVVKDRVKQTTTTTGTGSIVLNGNVSGFQTFTAALSNGDTTYYGIFEPSTNEYEVGLGTWTESTATLARTTVLESSNSGSAVNLTAQAEVFITQPAEKAVFQDSNGDVDLGGNKILFGNLYSTTNDLPSASTYHGMFAHVHGTGKAYYAHAGNWIELVNEDTSGNVSMGGNLTVTGDLTVNGTTTTINTTNTVVTDSLIELANGTTGSPSNDAGIVIERGDSNNAFIGYDESADKFTVGTGSFTGASTGNLTISTGTLVANVEGNVTGDVTGNADTATALETARTIGGVSFNGTANINLPGVNTAGNQDTSGNAATATTAGTVTTAAQPNITSLGTLTTLTVDDITINSSTISDASNLFLDLGGSLNIDAGNSGNVTLSDDGTQYGQFYTSTSNFIITSNVANADLILQGNDNGSYRNALTLDMSDEGTAIFNHDIKLGDNGKAIFGAGSDLEIYHDALNSYIRDSGTGHLYLQGTDVILEDPDGNNYIYCDDGGPVYLYYNGSNKLNTNSSGINIEGDINAVNNIYIADKIYHEGDTDTYIEFQTNYIQHYTGGTQSFYIDATGAYVMDGSLKEDYDALSGTTPDCNLNSGGAFSLTMSGNTTFTFTNPTSGYSAGFILQLTGNGSTVTWPNTVRWAGGTAPDAPANGETDILVFHTRDGGTNWYGVLASDAAA